MEAYIVYIGSIYCILEASLSVKKKKVNNSPL